MSGRHQRRRQIHLLGIHGDMSRQAAFHLLKRFVYPGDIAWRHFLRYALLALGFGFLLTGIVFFFAYNWGGLHRFAKLGIVGGLLVLCVGVSLKGGILDRIRRWFLLAAVLMTGVCLAVFGQIYQTGADSFEYFLGWSVFSLLWVIVGRFPLLWLGYLVILNLTLLSFLLQWYPELDSMTMLFLPGLLNALALWISLRFSSVISKPDLPGWYLHIISLAAVTLHTFAFLIGIYNGGGRLAPLWFGLITLLWAGGWFLGMQRRSVFWPALVGMALIIVISGGLFHWKSDFFMMLGVSLFIVAAVAALIAWITTCKKQWENGTR